MYCLITRVRTIVSWTALLVFTMAGAVASDPSSADFPRPLESYVDFGGSVLESLQTRIAAEPFNLVATIIFALAIIHTFLASKFRHWAHGIEERHAEKLRREGRFFHTDGKGESDEVSFWGKILHFFGEVEAVFGIWVIPLFLTITFYFDWSTAQDYLSGGVHYTEPIFIVVIMAIAGSRPIVWFSETVMGRVATLGKSTPGAWWFAILTIGPVLGSFITEPAAMTICALLLLKNFYRYQPSERLKYATLGLLFVNVSVGGTLTHFAAPPVLMVASKWGWGLSHMASNFGWKAVIGIIIANVLYYLFFRREFKQLDGQSRPLGEAMAFSASVDDHRMKIPGWVIVVHLFALAWTVYNVHHVPLFVGGFLVFLAFCEATAQFQSPIQLRGPLLVGFFLAGLVVHGTVQQWWIEPVLGSMAALPLMFGSIALTAFNDNAAITYLASLVPTFTEEMKYAVVAGAVTGGGLTVIANAPNPAGQSILAECFKEGVAPMKLLMGALVPTAIMAAVFGLLR